MMEIYALIGASGTGKSHNAINVAKEYDIDTIIDDGLLIRNGQTMAGHSAKTEPTMIGAVKCAIFNDPHDAYIVREKIKQIKPQKILILGTSEKMIVKIAETLDLPPIKEKIFITDIATPEEIKEALTHRKEGEHVIPLPAVEVRKDFWLSSIVGFFSKKDSKNDNDRSTIVRPKFSQLGTLVIADSVVEDIVRHCIRKYNELDRNVKVSVFNSGYGVNIYCEMKIRYGVHIQPIVETCQKELVTVLDDVTGINILKIDMRISGVVA